MTPGKIVIKENKVYFEPEGLEKPINPGIDGSFSEDINYIKDVEKYIASKQLIEVSNVTKNQYLYLIDTKERRHIGLAKNVQSCEAEVTDNIATITKIN